MSQRRTIIRAQPSRIASVDLERRRQRLRDKVEKAEAIVDRWWKRLQRAAKVIDKNQKQIVRLQRQLRLLPS